MNKCIGCGDFIESGILCNRCFRIRNYNEYKKINIDDKNIINIFDNISSNDLAILVIDILNIPQNFNIIKEHLKCRYIIALTKYDLIPDLNEQKYISYIKKFGLEPLKIILISSKNNYNLDYLYQTIISNTKKRNVYFIGYTNAGKSTLINKIIYNYSSVNTQITTSCMPNTTLDTIKIKLDSIDVIDTPGIINKNSIINYLSDNNINKITSKSKIRPISYQIKGVQTIIVDNIFNMELSDNNIIIYIPNSLNVKRVHKQIKSNLKEIVLDIKKTSDIVISGLGFVKVMKPGIVKLYTYDGVDVFVRDNLI